LDYLPIFLNVKGRRALIVGGGTMAARKADLLVRAECDITVVAATLNDDLARMVNEHQLKHKTGELCAADVDDCVVAFGSSEDETVIQRLCELAKAAGVPVNISDSPDHCDFIMPALVDRSPLLVAVGSGGTSPLLTRILKARFETTIPAAYGRLAEFAGSYRQRVKDALPDMARRLRFWETMIAGPIAEHLFSAQEDLAADLMDKLLDEAAADGDKMPDGEVYLVGTGPGDPDLLTFRALRLMQQADVVAAMPSASTSAR